MSVIKQQKNEEEVNNGLLSSIFEKGLALVIKNKPDVTDLDSVEERLEKGQIKYASKLEQKKYSNNVIPINGLEARVENHIETESETGELAMNIAKENRKNKPVLIISNDIEKVVSVLDDEEKLKKLNRDFEKLEETFDKQKSISSLTNEERKEKFLTFVNHYTVPEKETKGNETGHRKMKLFWDIVKSNWKNRKGFFSFFWESGKDYFSYRSVGRGLESYNAVVDIKNEYEDDLKQGAAKVEKGKDNVKLVLNAKKEAKIHTSGLYLLVLESIKKFITLPSKKNRTTVMNFMEKYPKEGRKVFKDLGMPLKGLARKARKTEAFARVFDWIFHPEKYNEGFLHEAGGIVLDVAPITGSYRDIRELFNDESEYSFGTRALFAGTSVIMDGVWVAGTFFSAGTASAPLAAARVSARAAMKGGARKLVGAGVMKGALKSISKISFKEYVKKLPVAARKYIVGKESAFLALFLLGDNAASLFWEKYNPLLKSYAIAAAKNVAMEKMTPEQIKMLNFAQRNLI